MAGRGLCAHSVQVSFEAGSQTGETNPETATHPKGAPTILGPRIGIQHQGHQCHQVTHKHGEHALRIMPGQMWGLSQGGEGFLTATPRRALLPARVWSS
jgi:hypothetical protein